MIDVFVNGVKLVNGVDYTATNGTTVVLTDALTVGQIVEIDNYLTAFLPTNALRTITTFTATAAQTTFSVTYTQGLIDVFYNGSNLAQSEYTATNGTSIVLGTACQLNDIVVVYAYSYAVGAYSGIAGSGTTNYVPKFTASSTIGNSLIFDNGTNVGIGTSSPSGLLSLKAEVTNTPTLVFQNVSGGPNSAISNFTSAAQTLTILGTNMYIDAASNIVRFNTSYQGSGIMFDEGIIRLYTGTSGITPTSRVSISSGGEVSINNSSTTARFNLFESAAKWAQIINHTRTAGQFFIQFQYDGTEIGAISGNASNTTYATSSDYRLKEDLKDFNGIELVSKINVYDFAWKSDNTRRMYGVLAHEMAELLPYAVNKEKDLIKEDGSIDVQGVDYSLITPLLVKAIQELKAEIEQLKQK
jgi:hypothetical protein